MMTNNELGLGWLKDNPDLRDFTKTTNRVSTSMLRKGSTETVRSFLSKTSDKLFNTEELPPSKNLKNWCTPIESQGNLGSCTANAAAGMIEYFENRAFGNNTNASRLFIYKTTRNILGYPDDRGAYLRSTMGAMALLGVPPEKYWPYDVTKYNIEPTPFVYAYAQSFQALTYYRLDPIGSTPNNVLTDIKSHIVSGLPVMFGFYVFSSIWDNDVQQSGNIPYPDESERCEGGHAIMAVGYDDDVIITNPNNNEKTRGAIMIRNSWGGSWGDNGYGYLPYQYLLGDLANDFWCLIKSEWLETGQFGE